MDDADRAVACPGWRWLPGMVGVDSFGHRFRVVEVDHDSDGYSAWVVYAGKGEVVSIDVDSRPDLRDAATRGALLDLVDEAWAKHGAVVAIEPDDAMRPGEGWEAHAYWPDGRSELVGWTSERSRASALVAALEAAGRRGGE